MHCQAMQAPYIHRRIGKSSGPGFKEIKFAMASKFVKSVVNTMQGAKDNRWMAEP